MTQRSGNVTECHKKPASISGGARQRQGVTYSCVRLEFYPNYNRFYQISAEIGHTPLHTFSLHTSALAGLLVIDGTWLENRLSGMFMSHCFLRRVFGNVLAVTLASLFADRASAHWRQSELNNDQCCHNQQWRPAFSEYSQHSSHWWDERVFSWLLCQNRRNSLIEEMNTVAFKY